MDIHIGAVVMPGVGANAIGQDGCEKAVEVQQEEQCTGLDQSFARVVGERLLTV